jgi:hypothetical protein
MTRQELNARPVVLTEKEIEQVTGGQAINEFGALGGMVVKTTGSLDTLTPPLPPNGTINAHVHVTQ